MAVAKPFSGRLSVNNSDSKTMAYNFTGSLSDGGKLSFYVKVR